MRHGRRGAWPTDQLMLVTMPRPHGVACPSTQNAHSSHPTVALFSSTPTTRTQLSHCSPQRSAASLAPVSPYYTIARPPHPPWAHSLTPALRHPPRLSHTQLSRPSPAVSFPYTTVTPSSSRWSTLEARVWELPQRGAPPPPHADGWPCPVTPG